MHHLSLHPDSDFSDSELATARANKLATTAKTINFMVLALKYFLLAYITVSKVRIGHEEEGKKCSAHQLIVVGRSVGDPGGLSASIFYTLASESKWFLI
jgi:hypothetical protein